MNVDEAIANIAKEDLRRLGEYFCLLDRLDREHCRRIAGRSGDQGAVHIASDKHSTSLEGGESLVPFP